ncbi:hypothetical protein BDZ94DRAFT_1267032 [Collybia nuda]|uniref:Secreted protein n=1 Tax=Collybia nuda TaxID=64659 RepID=A0A9P5XZI9_9AGAR|nr:hypothetical protein BDZ94DRAFT_1267032 [Collybia nuda]
MPVGSQLQSGSTRMSLTAWTTLCACLADAFCGTPSPTWPLPTRTVTKRRNHLTTSISRQTTSESMGRFSWCFI